MTDSQWTVGLFPKQPINPATIISAIERIIRDKIGPEDAPGTSSYCFEASHRRNSQEFTILPNEQYPPIPLQK